MQKQAPSLARVMVMAGFALSCFGLILFLWLAFGGPIPLKPKGYRFTVSFPRPASSRRRPTSGSPACRSARSRRSSRTRTTAASDATIELDERYAPLPSDTRAMLRQKTLLGETYVELTPGSTGAGTLPEDGQPAARRRSPRRSSSTRSSARSTPKTRDAFRSWMDQLALATDGRGADINAALGELAPFATDTNTLLKVLNAQQPTVRRLVSDTGDGVRRAERARRPAAVADRRTPTASSRRPRCATTSSPTRSACCRRSSASRR